MKRVMVSLAVASMLAVATTPAAAAQTTRIAFTATSVLTDVLDWGTEWVVGETDHVDGMVLVYTETSANPLFSGVNTVTTSYVFTPSSSAMRASTVLRPYAFPGEWYDCTSVGGWDQTGMTLDTRCIGHGEHLDGWQIRDHVTNETTITGYLFKPGD